MKIIILVLSLLTAPDAPLKAFIFIGSSPEKNTMQACEAAKHTMTEKLEEMHPTKLYMECVELDATPILPQA